LKELSGSLEIVFFFFFSFVNYEIDALWPTVGQEDLQPKSH